MKKRNLNVLKLRKHKISNLNLLINRGGLGTTDTETTGFETLPSDLPTVIGCVVTDECETKGYGGCNTLDTTKSLVDDSFGASCNAPGSLLGC